MSGIFLLFGGICGSSCVETLVSTTFLPFSKKLFLKKSAHSPSPKKHPGNNDMMRKAANKEIRILERLNGNKDRCRGIVTMYDHFDYRNHLCIVFESMNCSMRDALKKYSKPGRVDFLLSLVSIVDVNTLIITSIHSNINSSQLLSQIF